MLPCYPVPVLTLPCLPWLPCPAPCCCCCPGCASWPPALGAAPAPAPLHLPALCVPLFRPLEAKPETGPISPPMDYACPGPQPQNIIHTVFASRRDPGRKHPPRSSGSPKILRWKNCRPQTFLSLQIPFRFWRFCIFALKRVLYFEGHFCPFLGNQHGWRISASPLTYPLTYPFTFP